jgi:hypothetical protein
VLLVPLTTSAPAVFFEQLVPLWPAPLNVAGLNLGPFLIVDLGSLAVAGALTAPTVATLADTLGAAVLAPAGTPKANSVGTATAAAMASFSEFLRIYVSLVCSEPEQRYRSGPPSSGLPARLQPLA